MLRRSVRMLSISSLDVNEKQAIFLNHGGGGRLIGNRKRVIIGTWALRFPKDPTRLSPPRFILRIGAKVASAIRVVSMRRRSSSSRKISSSSNHVRPRVLLSDSNDSYRAKAVQDCIEFLHSSSSREERASSVA